MEFWFYQTEGPSFKDLMSLLYSCLQKAYENSGKSLVVSCSDDIDKINLSLWQQKKISFLPHMPLKQVSEDPSYVTTPILLYDSLNAMPDRDYLFIVQPYSIDSFESLLLFETKKVCLLFNQDTNYKAETRRIWQNAKSKGYPLNFVKRDLQNNWHKLENKI